MQNRYAGDVGDFGKYGLLKALSKSNAGDHQPLRLGVNWYLAPDENHNDDGKHISYLDDTVKRNVDEFMACDSVLYAQLQQLVRDDRRSVAEVERLGILPPDSLFYSDLLKFSPNMTLQQRIRVRMEWLNRGLHALRDAEVVFFDPDNGLEVRSCSLLSGQGVKYVGYSEVVDYYLRGQSLVIYNHRDRKPEAEYMKRITELRNVIPQVGTIHVLRFNRYSVRDYIIVPQARHEEIIERRISLMMSGPWKRSFTRIVVD